MNDLNITISGARGTGKTTLLATIADYLRKLGAKVITKDEPGSAPVAPAPAVSLVNDRTIAIDVHGEHADPTDTPTPHDANVEALIAEHRERVAHGFAKYGTTTERTDLSMGQWLQHAKEEAMDFAVYLQTIAAKMPKDDSLEAYALNLLTAPMMEISADAAGESMRGDVCIGESSGWKLFTHNEPGALTFNTLRTANVARCEASFHPLDDWTGSDWSNALAGEVGEACNVVKKLRRLDGSKPGANRDSKEKLREQLRDELGDVIAYADLLAARFDIDLGEAVCHKFNAVSDRVGSGIKLPAQTAPAWQANIDGAQMFGPSIDVSQGMKSAEQVRREADLSLEAYAPMTGDELWDTARIQIFESRTPGLCIITLTNGAGMMLYRAAGEWHDQTALNNMGLATGEYTMRDAQRIATRLAIEIAAESEAK